MPVAQGFFVAVVMLCLSLTAGCASWFKGDEVRPPVRDEPVEHWVIKPAELRVYPSTRFVRWEGELVLEARIEFVDELGDPIKAVGVLRFEVFRADRAGAIVDAKQLFMWDQTLLTKEENETYYDPVTRAYLFRLGVDRIPSELQHVVLRVQYTDPAGERLVTSAVIQTPG